MPTGQSFTTKAPLLNWDVFCSRYNSLMEDGAKQQQSILELKNIAVGNKWSKQQSIEAIGNMQQFVVVITDELQRICFISTGFKQMTGYSFEEIKGWNPKFLQGPGTNKKSTFFIREQLNKNENAETIVENYRRNGEMYLCKIIIKPIININQQLVNYIAYEQEIAA